MNEFETFLLGLYAIIEQYLNFFRTHFIFWGEKQVP
jgi:hypothetical protein